MVDDEVVTCVDYMFLLRELGAKPQAFLPSNAAALNFLKTHAIDAVVLDYRLQDGTSEPLIAWLREHEIPFVLISGWVEKLERGHSEAPILQKPAIADDLWRALSRALH